MERYMKGIILYKSKYGTTEKYAQWLSEATGFEMLETVKATVAALKDYDTIILGGGIYAHGIAGIAFLKKNFQALKDKKLIVFCDGASPFEQKAFDEIRKLNMKDELADIPLFYCRGTFDLKSMTFIDRKLCQMLQKAVAKKEPDKLEVWEKALMEAGNQRGDWTDKAYLEPILKELGL